MNASYEWLRAFVPFGETPQKLRDLLTSKVATVDELVPLRSDLAAIVVARVVEEGPHPDSDHLHVTRVDAGTGELLHVVCGAPNVKAGKLYPFAMSGTVMPNGLKIEKRRIRGEVSNGMICSARELGLGDDGEGVMELSIDVPPGTPFLRAVPVGDTRLVIDVGANRPDLLSHLGIAREIAAITGRPSGLPVLEIPLAKLPAPTRGRDAGNAASVAVHIEDTSLARRFTGVVVRGVKVGPSPKWLVDRLASVGSRSINNVVDASNYVLHELGQPTHAFDLTRLGGAEVRVRLARAGERIVTLDGSDRALTDGMIVIADAARPQGIAGIMGGRDSEVTDATTDLFIEAANFDPGRIRTARRALGMTSDAAYRFERGVDLEIAARALERVAQIILALAGGEVDGSPIDLRPTDSPRLRIPLRASRVAQVLGVEISADEIDRNLRGIGFGMARGDAEHMGVDVPSWRSDVTSEIDVVEEIARLHGFDAFADEIRPFRPGTVPDDPQWIMSRNVRDYLVGRGLYEVRPIPFIAALNSPEPIVNAPIPIVNPIAENEGYLRTAILGTLGRRAEFNLAHMQRDIRLFEVGDVFNRTKPTDGRLPLIEELHVAVLVLGRRAPRHFSDPSGDAFDRWASFGRWDVLSMADELCRIAFPDEEISIVPAAPTHDGHATDLPSWDIMRGGVEIGAIGRLPLDAPVWAAEAWGFELSLGVVDSAPPAPRGQHSYVSPAGAPATRRTFRPLPTTPAAEFDLALVLSAGQTAGDIERVIRDAAGELLERLELFDEYTGEGVDAGTRSVAWRLTFRHPERTLRDKEIEGRRAKILSVLEKELNVRPRTS